MKKLFNYWPYVVALLPQFIFDNYLWIMITIILIGIIANLFIKRKMVFLKMFVLELITISVVYFVYENRILYLSEVFENLNISEIFVSISFLVFNALNISILFFFGFKLSSLLLNKKNKITSQEL